nr:PREDICTED: type-2 angiotensin II receptor isoform X1 [Lepisosteus oculatus]
MTKLDILFSPSPIPLSPLSLKVILAGFWVATLEGDFSTNAEGVMTMTTILPNTSFSTLEVENLSSATEVCHGVPLSRYHTTLIPAIYSIIFIFGFIGNCLVVSVLCLRIGRKTVANTYILSLAISDIFFLLSLPMWAVYYSFSYNWIFGTVMCKVCGTVLCINLYASIFFITCMSVDRYRAIVHPFQSQSSRRLCRARTVTCIVWVLASLSSLPTMYFRNTYELKHGVTACVMDFPQTHYSEWFAGMALMKNTLGFLVPFTVIASCYLGIGKHLLGTPGLEQTSDKRDKVLRMVVAVVLAFFICWVPFHVITFLDVLTRLNVITSCRVQVLIDTAVPFTLCMAFSNSAINPFLYCFVGNHFRKQLSHLYERRSSNLSQKRSSISTRLSSFSRKLSDLKDMGALETFVHKRGSEQISVQQTPIVV